MEFLNRHGRLVKRKVKLLKQQERQPIQSELERLPVGITFQWIRHPKYYIYYVKNYPHVKFDPTIDVLFINDEAVERVTNIFSITAEQINSYMAQEAEVA